MKTHAKICKHKLMGCPRPGCPEIRSWYDMGHLVAPDCYRIELARTREEGWDVIFPFSDFFDPFTLLTRRAVEARRRILTTTHEPDHREDEEGVSFCRAVLYFEINPIDLSVCFYVVWADKRRNSLGTDLNRRVLMAASLYVSQGYWTEAGAMKLNFGDDNYNTGDSSRQLVVPHLKLFNWYEQAVGQNECIKCPKRHSGPPRYEPHLHLNVILP